MLTLIEQHRPEVIDLCRQFGVKRLDLIGSAARGDFDPAKSDLDFLVEFADQNWQGSSRRYFGLLHGLEDLFQKRIDLVERAAVNNPLFMEVAEKHRDLLYAA